MKITKSRLKEIIKEELQHEILGTYFANKAMKSIKDRVIVTGKLSSKNKNYINN